MSGMRTILVLPLVFLALLSVCLAGCVVVTSEHPLALVHDDRADERLIGWWELRRAPGSMSEGESGEEDDLPQARLVVGRPSEAEEDGLRWVLAGLDENGKLTHLSGAFRVTQLGDGWYASRFPQTDDDAWWISRLRLPEDGRGAAFQDLAQEWTARAIESGDVAGEVRRDDDGDLELVHLTASPERLREWLRSLPDDAWQTIESEWHPDPIRPR